MIKGAQSTSPALGVNHCFLIVIDATPLGRHFLSLLKPMKHRGTMACRENMPLPPILREGLLKLTGVFRDFGEDGGPG